MEIVIDGFNVIGSRGGLYGDVGGKRDAFVTELARYARLKGHTVTVVFDGFAPGLATGSGTIRYPAGVRVLFAEHERADDVIVRLARRLREGGTIVTSDREVQNACRGAGCVVVGARVFDQRMADALAGEGLSARGCACDPDTARDDGDESHDRTAKRGNPHKLPKAARKTRRRLGRL